MKLEQKEATKQNEVIINEIEKVEIQVGKTKTEKASNKNKSVAVTTIIGDSLFTIVFFMQF